MIYTKYLKILKYKRLDDLDMITYFLGFDFIRRKYYRTARSLNKGYYNNFLMITIDLFRTYKFFIIIGIDDHPVDYEFARQMRKK